MKSFICLLLLALASTALPAQSPHLVTISELKQLANCPEYTCLGSMANQWGYTYKGVRKGKLNGLTGSQYRYIRPHPNPMFAEFTASYWELSDNSRRVTITSDNKAWSAGLDRDIGQNGFSVVNQKSTLGSDDAYYVLNENGTVWHLIWQRPSMFTDTAPHTLTIYHDPVLNQSALAASVPDAGQLSERVATPVAQPATTNTGSDGEFSEFLNRFSTDPGFQLQRTFGAVGSTIVWQKNSRTSGKAEREQVGQPGWRHINFQRSPANDPTPAEWVFLPVGKYKEHERKVILSGIGNDLYIEYLFVLVRADYRSTAILPGADYWKLSSITQTIP